MTKEKSFNTELIHASTQIVTDYDAGLGNVKSGRKHQQTASGSGKLHVPQADLITKPERKWTRIASELGFKLHVMDTISINRSNDKKKIEFMSHKRVFIILARPLICRGHLGVQLISTATFSITPVRWWMYSLILWFFVHCTSPGGRWDICHRSIFCPTGGVRLRQCLHSPAPSNKPRWMKQAATHTTPQGATANCTPPSWAGHSPCPARRRGAGLRDRAADHRVAYRTWGASTGRLLPAGCTDSDPNYRSRKVGKFRTD